MTRILPTDKNGQVYYGPKTLKAAIAAVEATYDSQDRQVSIQEAARKVAHKLGQAGYSGVAARVIKHFDAAIWL